jgi:hypothetical protein
MQEQIECFCAVLLVVLAAVAIGAVIYGAINLATGGLKRVSCLRRCAMPKRIREGNRAMS